MKISEVSEKDLLVIQAVYRACNTNRRLKGSIYVRNPMSANKREISYYDALEAFGNIVRQAMESVEAEVSE